MPSGIRNYQVAVRVYNQPDRTIKRRDISCAVPSSSGSSPSHSGNRSVWSEHANQIITPIRDVQIAIRSISNSPRRIEARHGHRTICASELPDRPCNGRDDSRWRDLSNRVIRAICHVDIPRRINRESRNVTERSRRSRAIRRTGDPWVTSECRHHSGWCDFANVTVIPFRHVQIASGIHHHPLRTVKPSI